MSEALLMASTDRTVPVKYAGKLEPNYYCRGWNSKREKYCRRRAGHGTVHSGSGRCDRHGGQRRADDARLTRGGKFSRTSSRPERVRALIEQHKQDPQLFDVSATLATAKGLMDDFIDRYYEIMPMLEAWYSSGAPVAEDQKLALLSCLDELEETYKSEATDKQTEDLALARAAVEHLAQPRAEKPRQLLDISDAVSHADTISKIIHRVNMNQAQNAVSYARLATFMFELSRELDALLPDREQLRRVNERILQIKI